MAAYYNENEPYAAMWLRNLIVAGHIAPGDVDERSIADVMPSDLIGYTQCHFFAGIGGWSIALRLAEWPDDQPVWTGSCPCQPFSSAGKRSGAADERHLWPHWFRLIRERRPPTVFGEQVEAAIGWGWIDAVFADLESQGYACGAAVLPACGVGAPHIRQRLWFVADANSTGRSEQRSGGLLDGERPALGNDADGRGGVVDPTSEQVGLPGRTRQPRGTAGELGDADLAGLERRLGSDGGAHQRAAGPSGVDGFWSACDWLPCTDGKARPVEPFAQCMANGISLAMGCLRSHNDLKEKIDAAASIGFRDEVLRAMRDGHDATEVWRSLGGCLGFPQATLLLAVVREHTGQLGRFLDSAASHIGEGEKSALRAMQQGASSLARPSQGWRLSQQCAQQLADALSALSSEDTSPLAAYNGHPLAHGVQRRASKLRAYGNAIVPQVAARFIEAYQTRNEG